MSRYAQGGGNLVAANALQQVAAKENNYKEPIKVNHGLCKSAAQRIANLEKDLFKMVDDSIISRDELTKILNEHKETLKGIAAQNVERERHVEAFVGGVTAVRLELSNHNNDNDNDEQDPTNLPDYTAKIKNAMTQHKRSKQYADVKQEPLYRDVAALLGEKFGKTNGDDDDIEIEETQGAASLKCPITGRFLEQPLKNKACGHVYSHEGIMSHIRAKGRAACPCPVGGCANQNVTLQQLEKDVEMEMAVRRQKRREDQEMQQRASQADDLMDSDEE